ncbi:NAD(P)H-hydrate dehydratase [uncultured Psychrobacter sp.]|uniref:NAD(P)H-hydrate dehydratase n=1 Tax=uncultured Psychrobacter sp. TaxID=259303 RepID=UPI00261854DC|nr:NAD(P)H-hydrate dehydratase [uncultured Psychrobacter sp.]
MPTIKKSLSSPATLPIALYTSSQVYAIEQDWFADGYSSFALMQQAAWQMAQRIIDVDDIVQSQKSRRLSHENTHLTAQQYNRDKRAVIWAGRGNNGGDGWLIALYLQRAGWQVKVMTVGMVAIDKEENNDSNNSDETEQVSDALKAQRLALTAGCSYLRFEDQGFKDKEFDESDFPRADVYIDALFGIGLDRPPTGIYQQAITTFNRLTERDCALVVAVDVPSGLVASTGQVFERLAVRADITLCLVARKIGLHTKDGKDYAGEVLDIPLIPITSKPITSKSPAATLLQTAYALAPRQQNSYKGSYGHMLIIAGNRVDGSQGMGGAAILSASSAMATGAGKITVACHDAFHGALLTSLPDAMTIDLHDVKGVKTLIKDASVIAIGMGLGRDDKAKALFIAYLNAAIEADKAIVIDADGLYHLATLQSDEHELVKTLKAHSTQHKVYLTPHSGEAAMLLNKEISEIEEDRLTAIKQAADQYGGNWVLKGAGTLILEQNLHDKNNNKPKVYVCATGNAGMATAGMGDVLSGVCAGLLAQLDLADEARSLRQAVLVHGLAGDALLNQLTSDKAGVASGLSLRVGQRGMQAQDMPAAVRSVMEALIVPHR